MNHYITIVISVFIANCVFYAMTGKTPWGEINKKLK